MSKREPPGGVAARAYRPGQLGVLRPHSVEVPRGGARCRRGIGLPIAVGVARTKFLAEVASGVAKPDGLLVVPTDGELAFLHPLPVEALWGGGR